MNTYRLTPTEQRIAWALLQAKTNEELSAEFGLSNQTVKNHLTRMLKKTRTTHRLGFVLTLLQVTGEPGVPDHSVPHQPDPVRPPACRQRA